MATLTLTIDQKFADQVMSHGNVCAKKLADHTQAELLQLAIIARGSNNPTLVRCFTELPALSELTETKVEAQMAQISPAPVVDPTTKKK